MIEDYNKDYRTKENDRYSELDLQNQKKKPSFLTIVLIGLLILFVCSLGYDNWLKPYLAQKKEQTEQQLAIPSEEKDEVTIETSVAEADEETDYMENPVSKPIERKQNPPIEDVAVSSQTSSVPSVPVASQTSPSSQKYERTSSRKDYSDMSTLEIMERRNHEQVVRQAQRAGVSTEGTTLDIIERINRKSLERMGY